MATVLKGTPLQVDTFLRPILGIGRWVFGLGGGALLALLGWWWWVPVPLLLATAALEVLMVFRSDRAIRLRIDDDKLVVDDRFGPTLTIRWPDVHTVTVLERPRAGGWEVVFVLGGTRRVLCSLALQRATAVDRGHHVDEVDVHLGANAGLLRATAGAARAVRQRFHQADAFDALWQRLPPAAHGRDGLRVWRGAAPPLSPFAHHTSEPDGWMVLSDTGFVLTDAAGAHLAEGPLELQDWWVTEREAVLLRVAGADDADVGLLPMLVLDLGTARVAIPAPLLADHPRKRPAADDLLHTHAPEAVALIRRLGPTWGADMPPPWASDTAHAPPSHPGGPLG